MVVVRMVIVVVGGVGVAGGPSRCGVGVGLVVDDTVRPTRSGRTTIAKQRLCSAARRARIAAAATTTAVHVAKRRFVDRLSLRLGHLTRRRCLALLFILRVVSTCL